MKKVRFTRNTVAGGKPVLRGAFASLPEDEARYLTKIGKAVYADGTAEKGGPMTYTTRVETPQPPDTTSSDDRQQPKPKRARKPRAAD